MDCYIYPTKSTPQLYFATFLHTETSVTCSRFPSNNESKEVLSSSLLFYASKADRTLILQAISRNNQAKITMTKKNFSKVLYDHTNNLEIPLKYEHKFHQLKGLGTGFLFVPLRNYWYALTQWVKCFLKQAAVIGNLCQAFLLMRHKSLFLNTRCKVCKEPIRCSECVMDRNTNHSTLVHLVVFMRL